MSALLKASLAEHMKTNLVVQALYAAISKRKPGKGLIHQSDKGSPSYCYQRALRSNHMLASFTGTGVCFGQRSAEACRLMP